MSREPDEAGAEAKGYSSAREKFKIDKVLVVLDGDGHNHVYAPLTKDLLKSIYKQYDQPFEDDLAEPLDWDMINQSLMEFIPCHSRELIVDVQSKFKMSEIE